MTITIPWPTWPTVTATGNRSAAKTAGKRVPWLSANNVTRMHPRLYHASREVWCAAGVEAGAGHVVDGPWPVLVEAVLLKHTSHVMDSFAVLEGIKHVLDGLVRAGTLPDDDPSHTIGGFGRAHKAARDEHCVRLTFHPATHITVRTAD